MITPTRRIQLALYLESVERYFLKTILSPVNLGLGIEVYYTTAQCYFKRLDSTGYSSVWSKGSIDSKCIEVH